MCTGEGNLVHLAEVRRCAPTLTFKREHFHIGEEKIAAGSFHSPTVLSAAAGNQRRSAAVK